MTAPADKPPGGHDFMLPSAAFDRAEGEVPPGVPEGSVHVVGGGVDAGIVEVPALPDSPEESTSVAQAFSAFEVADKTPVTLVGWRSIDYPPLRPVTPPEFPTPWRWGSITDGKTTIHGLLDAKGNLVLGPVPGRVVSASMYVAEVTALAPELEALVRECAALLPRPELDLAGVVALDAAATIRLLHRIDAMLARLNAARKAGRDG